MLERKGLSAMGGSGMSANEPHPKESHHSAADCYVNFVAVALVNRQGLSCLQHGQPTSKVHKLEATGG